MSKLQVGDLIHLNDDKSEKLMIINIVVDEYANYDEVQVYVFRTRSFCEFMWSTLDLFASVISNVE